jgi:predicted SprT family Zn-dependent metalloprotease
MTLREARVLANELMEEHMPGLRDDGWDFVFDNAKGRCGVCKFKSRTIGLSRHYVRLNADQPEEIRDTILHEIAHAIAGPGAGHGREWKLIAMSVGARPIRCAPMSVVMPPRRAFKWFATCNACGHEYKRRTLKGFVARGQAKCRCGLGDSLTFTRIYATA